MLRSVLVVGRDDHGDAAPHHVARRVALIQQQAVDDVLEPSLEVRRVSSQGFIKWSGDRIFVSQALAGEWVALKPVDYDIHQIYFARFLIGRLIEKKFI